MLKLFEQAYPRTYVSNFEIIFKRLVASEISAMHDKGANTIISWVLSHCAWEKLCYGLKHSANLSSLADTKENNKSRKNI